jgi:hypothetical protein
VLCALAYVTPPPWTVTQHAHHNQAAWLNFHDVFARKRSSGASASAAIGADIKTLIVASIPLFVFEIGSRVFF